MLTPMMQQYLDLKEEYQDCILMFRLGDFYEMFFDDAKTASNVLEIALTGRDCGMQERAPMCGVPHHSVDNYIAKLIAQGYKVAICDQLEAPVAGKSIVKRGITRVITPGTVIENSMLEEGENNYLMCIAYPKEKEGNIIGISYCDVSTGELCTASFEEESGLLNEIIRVNPKEIITADSHIKNLLITLEHARLKHIFANPYFDYAFDEQNAKDRLKEHFKVHNLDAFSLGHSQIVSTGALVGYLYGTQKNSLLHINKIVNKNKDNYITIDNNTRRNLELTRTIKDNSKKGSLLWLINKTKTAMGARLLNKYILVPLKNPKEINLRLDAVEEIKEDMYLRNSLCEYLKGVYDLERIITKISYGTIDGRDCLSLKNSLNAIPYIKELLKDAKSDLLKEIYANTDTLEDVYSLLNEAINEDCPHSITEGNIIKQGFSVEVDALIDACINGKNWLAELEAKEREQTGIKNLKIGYNKVFGYFIEVTKSNITQVPYRYLRKQTLSNCERYITEELKSLEDTILGGEEKRNTLEYKLFLELRDYIATCIERIQQTAANIAILDCMQSFAFVAYENNYVKPKIKTNGKIDIKEGRHPVVEKLNKMTFVPNDALLDKETNNMLLITGPNMAGKSTFMRQIGLIVLMAQIGCFVPAKSAEISIVDRIFTRVGASDDLASGQSTFMVEMNELANILNCATKDSLIILDEIGRGTSTVDGMSIAWASIEYIINKIGAKTLFATHYHELTELEHTFKNLKNFSVAVKEMGSEIIFLHKIIKGGTDKSFGIEVARLAGLPNEVITQANKFLDILQKFELSLSNANDATKGEKPKQPKSLPKFLKQLDNIDLNSLTPIEALNVLNSLKQDYENEKN